MNNAAIVGSTVPVGFELPEQGDRAWAFPSWTKATLVSSTWA